MKTTILHQCPLHQGRSIVLCQPGWDRGGNSWEVSTLPTRMEGWGLHHPYLCCTGTEPTWTQQQLL